MINNKRIQVTGSESMIGTQICNSLKLRECIVDKVLHEECDLLEKQQIINRIANFKPDYLIHAAGFNGGISFNKEFPATIYYRTVMMGLNVLESCIDTSVQKTVSILASCSYPDIKSKEFKETDIWNGKSNNTVECHGMAKRTLLDFSRQISKQHDLYCVCCVLNNSFGPQDSYHPQKTKVIGALIRRFVEAEYNRKKEVVCWGTGSPLREFIYCKDSGEAIVQTLERYNDTELPLNISSGQEISIKELSEMIAEEVGYTGKIVWDTSKPDGQMRKKLNISRMYEYLDVPITSLRYGLKETIKWYKNNKEEADAKTF